MPAKNHKELVRDESRNFVCTESACGKRFASRVNLTTHIRKVHSEPVECPRRGCGAKVKKACLVQHIKQQHNKIRAKCENCGREMLSTSLREHLKCCTRPNDYTKDFACTEEDCGKAFFTAAQRDNHVRGVHNGKVKCPIEGCGTMVKPWCIKVHLEMVHERKRASCDNCGKSMVARSLRLHRQTCLSDGSRPFKCTKPGCSKDFRTSYERSIHLRMIHRALIECPIPGCERVFSRLNLVPHIKGFHERVKAKCNNCGASLSYTHLKRHENICLKAGPRNWSCSVEGCDRRFMTEDRLQAHRYLAHGTEGRCPYEGCETKLNPSSVSKHLKYVHNEAVRNCGNCGKLLAPMCIKRHEKRCYNNGVRVHKCQRKGCNKSFAIKMDMRSHMRAVHEKRIECPFPDCKAKVKPVCLSSHVRHKHDKLQRQCPRCDRVLAYSSLTRHLKTAYCRKQWGKKIRKSLRNLKTGTERVTPKDSLEKVCLSREVKVVLSRIKISSQDDDDDDDDDDEEGEEEEEEEWDSEEEIVVD